MLVAAVAASLFFAPNALAGWCGTGVTAQDLPDLVTGAQFHAVVVLPADAPDTFAADANRMADELASMTGWWQGQDGTRIPRFDTASFNGTVCLDISFVRLPDIGASYVGASASFSRISQQLRTLGFFRTAKDYLVYYDGPSVEVNICGTGQAAGRSSSLAVMWLQGCSGVPYDGVSAHELLHALGALPSGAPHACPGDPGHPCDAPFVDVLSPQTDGRPLGAQVLDFNHDDYYAHSGSWLDVQDSIFLHRLDVAPVTVSVSMSGGTGEVTSDLPGIDCTSACTTQWDVGSQILLSADADPNRRFVKWTGACSGYECLLDVTQPASVTAVFGPLRIRLRVAAAGKGTVRCSPKCTKTFPGGDPLTLRAVPANGWRFTGWSGGCKGTQVTCKPATDFALSVKATFRKR